ncbi:hypothetical protein GCM10010112_79640 [Actinoplanes lobatus]|uniref:Uncharacterized protein n=1 Tax=Actinoplanes lobatus TaxID=113568 RepID=A0A7W7MHY3_9ACTN|nr:hypothetical protein [Actinoplanes lobatus]MBB4750828.1 hypothetical protein [Actinoplanes lobatus]GGN92439.1 hypothetical protein GCM10010112_79640 [Actinoplanes lobatus]GIE44383.1 hypothetical protein Alo02nite_72810 [Actinoplanes lobatus]
MSNPPPATRPGGVSVAALLLWLCAALQLTMCFVGSTVYDGFPGNIWICGGLVTMPLFAAAAMAVWSGYPGAHIATAALPLLSVWCAGLAVQNPSGPALAWLVLATSMVAQAGAVVLVLRPSSLAFFHRPPGATAPPSATPTTRPPHPPPSATAPPLPPYPLDGPGDRSDA